MDQTQYYYYSTHSMDYDNPDVYGMKSLTRLSFN